MVSRYKTAIVDMVGLLAYVGLMIQAGWTIALVSPLLIGIDIDKWLPESQPSCEMPAQSLDIPVLGTVIGIIVVIVFIFLAFYFVKRTSEKTLSNASAIFHVSTERIVSKTIDSKQKHKRRITVRHRRALSARVLFMIKMAIVLVCLGISLIAPGASYMPDRVSAIVSLFLAGVAASLFALQALLAYGLRVDYSKSR